MNIKSTQEEKEKSPEKVLKEQEISEGREDDNESIESEGRYWSTHLEFHDIDDLMADL